MLKNDEILRSRRHCEQGEAIHAFLDSRPFSSLRDSQRESKQSKSRESKRQIKSIIQKVNQ